MTGKLLKVLRFLLVTLFVAAIVVPMALYIAVSTDWGRGILKDIGEKELSNLLGTEVTIGSVWYEPLNHLKASDIRVKDDNGCQALHIGTLDGAFELWTFIKKQHIIIDYADIDSLDLILYRKTADAPLNIDKIIKKLTKKDPNKPPTILDLRINDVNIANSSVRYDVQDMPQTPGRFNTSHMAVHDLTLHAFAPRITNDTFDINLEKLGFTEASGLELSTLKCHAYVSPKQIKADGFDVKLSRSHLALGDLTLDISGFDDIKHLGTSIPLDLCVEAGSHVYLPDLKPFVPSLGDYDYDINLAADISGTTEQLDIRKLRISDTGNVLTADIHGCILGIAQPKQAIFRDFNFSISTAPSVPGIITNITKSNLPENAKRIISQAGNVDLKGSIDGKLRDARIDIDMTSAIANAAINGTYSIADNNKVVIDIDADIADMALGTILDKTDFNTLSGKISAKGIIHGNDIDGNMNADISQFDFKGYRYTDFRLSAEVAPDKILASLDSKDPNALVSADINASKREGIYYADAMIDLEAFHPEVLNLGNMLGYDFKSHITASAMGSGIDAFKGNLTVSRGVLTNSSGERLTFDGLTLDADNIGQAPHISLDSDYIDANIEGPYNLATIANTLKQMAYGILPPLAPNRAAGVTDKSAGAGSTNRHLNRFSFDVNVRQPETLCSFFKLPVKPISTVEIYGNIDELGQKAFAALHAPWIQQGSNSVIENTSLTVNLDSGEGKGTIYATSLIPTKKGDMEIVATVNAEDGDLDTNIDWKINRQKPINGVISFLTSLSRDHDGHMAVLVNFAPGRINFGQETWNINPSIITYTDNSLTVNNFMLSTPTQSISVNGVAGPYSSDMLMADLQGIEIVEIFKTLDIDNVLIGGYATGTVYAKGLLGKQPDIRCDRLYIKDIGYNYCTIGDGVVKLALEDKGRIFRFNALVTEPGGEESHLDGFIEPATETLDLKIDANHVKVGFLKPFMSAFADDVSGYASGQAHLFGTFSDLDMTGDIQADNFALKIGFTNTWYHTNDRVKIDPGIINLRDVTLYDEYDKPAKLNGWVKHKYFHNASFDITVTDAHNFLCYNMSEKLSPHWYGTVFGNGNVTVKGEPGNVDIGVNLVTTQNSVFTFVLMDAVEASEYSFITFRDVTPKEEPDSVIDRDVIPEAVKLLRQKKDNKGADSPTSYNIDLNVDITPQAQMILVMDPVGGDRIKASGSGHVRMTYTSSDEDLRLYGTYTLDKGSYNFTLQDIIIRDFTIKEGSNIAFTGDPYAARLDIDAYYQINANLSDLDESFLQDKDLNRTNVPVRALLKLTGDMRQPDINFDLEFPTLTTDTYRKVKSIVSTEDMMNRQIIYLLALNRFYTPEYMASTTKGNELFSVASSTISSQLSSMLGKLSENWSIAPNLRSDRGDFSDVEVDVSLSSSLLNNRLLINGNLGYRDKSLNTNQFIGDFDIEYLLTRSGMWRLKAYNRYNDQNYYLRTAQTTQGLGIVYRKDFDNVFSFLKKLKRKPEIQNPETEPPAESIAEPSRADSIR